MVTSTALEEPMTARWCACCAKAFDPAPQVPRQTYCSDPACQRERRRLWQVARRLSDPDYLKNQADAQSAWARRNPDYWKAYRESHEDYVERNRDQQRVRNARRNRNALATMAVADLHEGLDELQPIQNGKIAR
jgi:hypothetical protein